MNEIKQIEDYLFRNEEPEETLLTEARLLLDEEFGQKLSLHQQSYRLISSYGRKKLREEIAAVDRQLFQDARHQSFRDKIFRLFFNP